MRVTEESPRWNPGAEKGSGAYDLVLLDIMLPGCSGYDICRTVRDEIDIPILMVTARSEAVDVIRGLGLGADEPGCGDRAPHLEGVEAWAGAEAS